jgi:hypothetical protein
VDTGAQNNIRCPGHWLEPAAEAEREDDCWPALHHQALEGWPGGVADADHCSVNRFARAGT